MSERYLEATKDSGKAFFSREIPGEVYMLNLLQFRDVADYSDFPELATSASLTGKEAFQRYINHMLPLLNEIGGEVIFQGRGGTLLIGPQDEEWDWMLLVKYSSRKAFLKLSSSKEFLAVVGHRLAALQDSRLLPIVKSEFAT